MNKNTKINDNEFLSIVKIALELAFEAGKWAGQVELEEHFDREQYASALIESIYIRKMLIPMHLSSTNKSIIINLRSDIWRKGVIKSAKEYMTKAFDLIVSNIKCR